jgi:uncharacterized protein YigE (DUF2233 family)
VPRPQPEDATTGIALASASLPADGGSPAVPLLLARIDLLRHRLRVHYAPHAPQTLSAWHASLGAALVVNGGFFTPEWRSTALVVSDGTPSESSYVGFGGMLAVDARGDVTVRALAETPYDASEPLEQAVQSFPMLVLPGGRIADLRSDALVARRTAVALDRAGQLWFIITPLTGTTLMRFATWLAGGDLAIDVALNLDGGSSTGMLAGPVDEPSGMPAFIRLPTVISVAPRDGPTP